MWDEFKKESLKMKEFPSFLTLMICFLLPDKQLVIPIITWLVQKVPSHFRKKPAKHPPCSFKSTTRTSIRRFYKISAIRFALPVMEVMLPSRYAQLPKLSYKIATCRHPDERTTLGTYWHFRLSESEQTANSPSHFLPPPTLCRNENNINIQSTIRTILNAHQAVVCQTHRR